MNRLLSIIIISMILHGCEKQQEPSSESDITSPAVLEITIMTFNVENLFDTKDEEGKDDLTFLPRSAKSDPAHIAICETIEVERWRRDCLEIDWNDEVLDFKLNQVAKTILQVNDGRGPDIIAFQEIENVDLLNRLTQQYMSNAGYGDAILIEGQDARGIDVAFLSRLPLVGDPLLHAFEATGFPDRQRDTRGVLEATFELPDGSLITGFSVHFPAPFHPIEMRELAYDHLNSLRSKVPAEYIVFAAGDFNTTRVEMTETAIYDERVRPFWLPAHEGGCEGCKGTSYWDVGKYWSFLDTILFSQAEDAKSNWQIKDGGIFIANQYPDQLNEDGTVQSYDPYELKGVSDHLPLVMTLQLVEPK